MPTYAWIAAFRLDFKKLSPTEKAAFLQSVRAFVEDLESGSFRPGLRIKGVRGVRRVSEMTWAQNGRATFEYGAERIPGEAHIIWRRVGTHEIFDRP